MKDIVLKVSLLPHSDQQIPFSYPGVKTDWIKII